MTVDQIRDARTALDALDAVLDGLTRPGVDALTFRPMRPLPIPDFVSPKEAAAALKVHPRTIRGAAQRSLSDQPRGDHGDPRKWRPEDRPDGRRGMSAIDRDTALDDLANRLHIPRDLVIVNHAGHWATYQDAVDRDFADLAHAVLIAGVNDDGPNGLRQLMARPIEPARSVTP